MHKDKPWSYYEKKRKTTGKSSTLEKKENRGFVKKRESKKVGLILGTEVL